MALAQAQHRVVVTGIGAVTSMGLTFDDTWNNILKGHSGVRKHEFAGYPNMPCRIAGLTPSLVYKQNATNSLSIGT